MESAAKTTQEKETKKERNTMQTYDMLIIVCPPGNLIALANGCTQTNDTKGKLINKYTKLN